MSYIFDRLHASHNVVNFAELLFLNADNNFSYTDESGLFLLEIYKFFKICLLKLMPI